jgi:c-di-GMP-binding flagellar brake protein YcgR
MRLFNSLKGTLERMNDRRRAARIPEPMIIAYFWNGAEPVPHRLRDVSQTGAYMYTAERWYVGTILQLTLDADRPGDNKNRTQGAGETMTLWSKVIRHGSDGVGLEFLIVKRTRQNELERFLTHVRGN